MINDQTKYAIIPIEYDEETRNYIVMYNNNEFHEGHYKIFLEYLNFIDKK